MRPVMRLVALASVLAGCGGDGVFVEVHTERLEVPVDRVELVLSARRCLHDGQDCPYIQGESFPAPMGEPDDIYERGIARSTNQLDGGVAVFLLPEGTNTLPLGFAVARDVQGQIVGAAVMESQLDLGASPIIYRVTLDPIEPLIGRSDPSRAGVAEWRTGLDECLAILPVTPDRNGKPLFMVPKDNPDCDSATPTNGATECDPFWYDGFSYDFANGPHCARPSQVIAGAPCVLGHVPTCVENVGAPGAETCIETARDPNTNAICLPSELCIACDEQEELCQQQLLQSLSVPRFDCVVPAEMNAADTVRNCSANEFAIVPDTLPTEGRCVDAVFMSTPEVNFHTELDKLYVDGTNKFEITAVDPDSCTIRMKWEGSILVGNIAHTILEVTIEGTNVTRRLWLPIKFAPSQQCPADVPECTFVDAPTPDSIFSCAE